LDGGDCKDCKNLVEDFERVGNGVCDGGKYNSAACSNDGGDCDECNKKIKLIDDGRGSSTSGYYSSVSDGPSTMSGESRNSTSGYYSSASGGETTSASGEASSVLGRMMVFFEDRQNINAPLEDFERVGDGICDGEIYNSEVCSYDGGDCNECNKLVVNWEEVILQFLTLEMEIATPPL